jgi:amino acid transporter
MEHQTSTRSAGESRLMAPERQKSGLVRTAGGWDSFIYSLAGISVGIMFAWGTYFGTGFYAGANLVVALVIATALALVVAMGYQFWVLIFPRSGGDYVYLSRGLHPGFALGANFVYVWILMASPAFAMSIMQPLVSGFAAALDDATGWGFLDDFSSWANTNLGYAVIGTLFLLIPAIVCVFGLRPTIRLMKILFWTGTIGLLITAVALLFSSTSTFTSNLEESTGLTVGQITSAATENGFAFGGFDLGSTIEVTVWFVTSLFFASLLVYIGGEMKNVRGTARPALAGAVIFSGVATLVWIAALGSAIPERLQGALAYNSLVVPDSSTAQVPYAFELMRILWGTDGFGLVLTIIGFVAVFAWVLIWGPIVLSFSQRAILAWALDGLVPRVIGSVNERWHTPLPALIVAFLMGEAFMLTFAFDPDFRTIILLVPLYLLLGVSMLIGTLFPFIRKDMFEQSIVGKVTFMGVPLMSLVCGAATLILAVWGVMLFNDEVASGTDRTPIWVVLGIIAGITLYYLGLRAYKQRQGEDITMTFKRIPVE